MDDLRGFVARALAAPVPPGVRAVAAALAEARADAVAILFYGSNLRTGALDGVLDFYVLTDGPPEPMWPTVGYRELAVGDHLLRAKIATMRIATFARAAAGETRDTTIWARFVQPAALVWARDDAARAAVEDAVAAAAVTAARFAAALGPARGTAADYWRALFRATYAAELRVEPPGREAQILAHGAGRYEALLPLAWTAAGIAYEADGDSFAPHLADAPRVRAAWARVRRWGRPLNVARLVRAAFTFEGAGAYGAWKVERHTGVPVPLTPFRAKHPILAAPAILWRVRRARRKAVR